MSETIYFGPDEIRASNGKFRTTNRYIRGVPFSSRLFVVAKGPTIALHYGRPSYYDLRVYFRYSVGGYIVQPQELAGFNFNATIQDVTL